MNVKTMTARAALMARTEKVPGSQGCRVPSMREVGTDWGEDVLALGWALAGGEGVPPSSTYPVCGTAGCVMHLEIQDVDERHEDLVRRTWKPARSLAQMFRDGRARGLFKGINTYAD